MVNLVGAVAVPPEKIIEVVGAVVLRFLVLPASTWAKWPGLGLQ